MVDNVYIDLLKEIVYTVFCGGDEYGEDQCQFSERISYAT